MVLGEKRLNLTHGNAPPYVMCNLGIRYSLTGTGKQRGSFIAHNTELPSTRGLVPYRGVYFQST